MKKKSTRTAPQGTASDGTARDDGQHGHTWRDRPWTGSYGPGVPADLVLPEGSLVDLMDSSVRRYGSKTALEFFGARTSYRELGALISRAAAGRPRRRLERVWVRVCAIKIARAGVSPILPETPSPGLLA